MRLYRILLPILLITALLTKCSGDFSQAVQFDATYPASLHLSKLYKNVHFEDQFDYHDIYLDVDAGVYFDSYSDEVTNDYLDYYLYIPEHARIGMPVVIFLHGDGEVGNSQAVKYNPMFEKTLQIYGQDFPYIAIAPCTRVRSWTSDTIPDTLMGLIEHTADKYMVDKDKIIITGHSRGAMGVWHMISNYGDYFHAAIPISCGNDTELIVENCRNVRILGFAGNVGEYELDYYYAMLRAAEAITNAGGSAEIQLLNGKNHAETAWEAFSEDTFTWMLN